MAASAGRLSRFWSLGRAGLRRERHACMSAFRFGEVEVPLPDYQSGCQSQLVFFVSWTRSLPSASMT